MPTSANSVVVTLTQGTAVLTRTLARPAGGGTSSATFSGLAYGAYAVGVRAYPTTDGSGVAQAVGAGSLAVAEGAPGTARVALAPNPLALDKGQSATATVSATDASGAIVLLSAGGATEPLAWSVDAPANAGLATSGLAATLKGLHSGGATLRVSMVVDDAGRAVSASVPVTVNAVDDGGGTVVIH